MRWHADDVKSYPAKLWLALAKRTQVLCCCPMILEQTFTIIMVKTISVLNSETVIALAPANKRKSKNWLNRGTARPFWAPT